MDKQEPPPQAARQAACTDLLPEGLSPLKDIYSVQHLHLFFVCLSVLLISPNLTFGQPSKVQQTTAPAEKKSSDKDTVLGLTFDDLTFEMETGDDFERSMLTDQINQYNGQTIRLRGFIRPSIKQSGITKFVFVRDNKECCFGPGAALYDCVLVKLATDAKTDYTVRPITIEGEFFLKEYKGPDGNVWSIYRIKNGRVK